MAVDYRAAGLAIAVIVAVILAWKFLKFAFKIGVIIAAAVLIFFIARWAAWI
jgi:hypothetical protein